MMIVQHEVNLIKNPKKFFASEMSNKLIET